ncbi:hypothetical protein FOC84_10570 [Achromobacter pestifer]|uniref:Uncharacterized protein n=1 Tax=Achromobacter pestifer TaxID=1353889 RepID=A0A7D4I7D2_9BURK|nr:hypothetical protein [Achromobacter pestifer]QKH35361.1 hypothetical protein FOC84_10570 [Achromobacter pestifer]
MSTAVDIAIAIGTTFAAALHEAGRPHLLCDRLARDQLTLEDGHRHLAVPGLLQINRDQIDRQMDLVFLVVKVAQS